MSAEKEVAEEVARSPFLRWALVMAGGAVLGLLNALIGLALRKHNKEMEEMKKGIASVTQEVSIVKNELHTGFVRSDQFEQTRRETREGIIALHGKIEAGLGTVHTKIDSVERGAVQRHSEIMTALLNHVSNNGGK